MATENDAEVARILSFEDSDEDDLKDMPIELPTLEYMPRHVLAPRIITIRSILTDIHKTGVFDIQERGEQITDGDIKRGVRITHLWFPPGSGATSFLVAVSARAVINNKKVGCNYSYVCATANLKRVATLISECLSLFSVKYQLLGPYTWKCTNSSGVVCFARLISHSSARRHGHSEPDSLVVVDNDSETTQYDASKTHGRVIFCHYK